MTASRFVIVGVAGLVLSVLWRPVSVHPAANADAVAADRPIAIIGATVIPMTDAPATLAHNARRLLNHTVLIRAGRIIAVGPADSLTVPEGTLRIDGRGRFIIPGLVDAHVHLLGRESSADLMLYIANGVTTVRNMSGEAYHVSWRGEIATGSRSGPTLFTSSAFTDGLTSVVEARAFVRRAHAAGYDAIKVHLPLPPAVYEALSTSAQREGIPVVGHAPHPGGLGAALRAGQRTIEHAESIMQAETDEQKPDTADITRIAALLRGSGVCVTPTLVTFDHIIRMTEQYPTLHDLLARPEMTYVRTGLRTAWAPSANEYVTRWQGHEVELPSALARFRRQAAWMRRLVGALAASGIPLLAGTDASVATVVPGFSLHEELRLLVDAGLPPYVVLRAATTNAASCFGRAGDFGVVAPGARADLVILDQDPLTDIRVTEHPVAVVTRGRWFPSDSLRRLMTP